MADPKPEAQAKTPPEETPPEFVGPFFLPPDDTSAGHPVESPEYVPPFTGDEPPPK